MSFWQRERGIHIVSARQMPGAGGGMSWVELRKA
jgi:hypothetical protein